MPAQQRLGPRWYTGSADAIFQSPNLIYDDQPDFIVVFGADHVYRMDPRQMVDAAHRDRRRRDRRRHPGAAHRGQRVRRHRRRRRPARCSSSWRSRPTRPACRTPRRRRSPRWATTCSPPTRCSRRCEQDAERRGLGARHGRRHHADAGRSRARPTSTTSPTTSCPAPTERDRGYWRDVGTIDAYYDAHMDLVSVHPIFNLYNDHWPIFTLHPQLPPAKFVEGGSRRSRWSAPARSSPAATVRHSVRLAERAARAGA